MAKKRLLITFALASALGAGGGLQAKQAWDLTSFSETTMLGVMGSWNTISYGYQANIGSDSLLYYQDPESGSNVVIPETSGLLLYNYSSAYWGLSLTEGDSYLWVYNPYGSTLGASPRMIVKNVSANALITIVTEVGSVRNNNDDVAIMAVDTNLVRRVEGSVNSEVGERVTNVFQVKSDVGDSITVDFYQPGGGLLKVYSVSASDMTLAEDVKEVLDRAVASATSYCDTLTLAGLNGIQDQLLAQINAANAADPTSAEAMNAAITTLNAALAQAETAYDQSKAFAALIEQCRGMVAERPSDDLSAAITDAEAIYNNVAEATAETIANAYTTLRTAKNVYIAMGVDLDNLSFSSQSGNYYYDPGNGVAYRSGYSQYTTVDGVMSVLETSTDAVIPETVTIGGKEYVVIGFGRYGGTSSYSLFSYPERVNSVMLPATLRIIGSNAFQGCTNLKAIDIPGNVSIIGDRAFQNCSALDSIALPAVLDSLGTYAFYDCDALKEIVIPEGVKNIGANAFQNCNKLESVALPDGIRSIGGNAFNRCSALTDIQLPDSLLSIGAYAFQYCSSLKELTLPAKLSSIGDFAFQDMTLSKLTSLAAVPPTLGSSPFQDLYTVYVSAGSGAAYRAADIWKDYIIIDGDGVALNIDVDVPGNLGRKVLAETENMEDVNYLTITGSLNSDDIYDIQNRLTNLIEIDLSGIDMTSMPSQMFYQRSALQKIVLPAGLQSIGSNAMYQCYSLKAIELPATLTQIDDNAFRYCSALESVVVPEGVASIGQYAFANCAALKSVSLPSTLPSLPSYAFYNDSRLENVSMAVGTASIGSNAFSGASSLAYIVLPSTLQIIDNGAFSNTAIKQITLPATVTYCGSTAFSDSTKDITCLAMLPPTLSNNSHPIDTYTEELEGYTLRVPNISLVDYKLTQGWDAFDIVGINSLPDDIIVHTDYTLNLPDTTMLVYDKDSVLVQYKPNVFMHWDINNSAKYAALTVNGSQTFSMGEFEMTFNPYNAGSSSTSSTRNYYNSLISNAPMRADTVYSNLYLRVNRWNFVTFPYDVKVSDLMIYDPDVNLVIRKYDGAARAAGESGSTWVDMEMDSVLHAGEGYIWQAYTPNDDYARFYVPAANNANKNLIFASERRTVALEEHVAEFSHNRSWNLVGNPFPCYYDTRYMEFTAPFTVWDISNQTYEAYSPVDDEYILRPGEAFFVQRPVDMEAIAFPTEGRQTDMTVRTMNNAKMLAPMQGSREVFNLYLSDGERTDRTRFVINDAAARAYDMTTDAGKFESTDKTMAQLYTIEGGVNMAINERPMADGVVRLGAYFGKTGSYSISLDTRAATGVTLIDHLTGKTADLTMGEYLFEAEAGRADDRFEIRLANGATGIDGVNSAAGAATVTTAAGTIIVEAAAGADIAVYTADGKTVATTQAASATFSVAPGLYIVAVGSDRYKVTVNK